ncbi:M20/M25/M40 family metallo-hydrolase [Streptomyces sp. MJP52]|uniref:M20/M25/M40 family metallo-hydrolase n=1 Tax=Streptomyces sp. MJP52 TaxID=2940555 RepID=UPI0024742D8A|nr:M20/M25/M40 family metallo-hydrolase [Streptomyces sp. MJP52]MDH6229046.1 hypothetical protein [Streptomyces sp. MJP52]
MPVLFFDIGATLADAHVRTDGSLMLRPRPRVEHVLGTFGREWRKGIISDPGPSLGAAERAETALHQAFVAQFRDDRLIHWGPKTSRTLFDTAAASAVAAGEEDASVFVGEDARERAFAREAGMRTAPHPVFTRAAVEDRPVLWARITLPDGTGLPELEAVANEAEVVPVHVASERLVLAMTTTRGAEALAAAGFLPDLRGAVEETTAFLVRDDRPSTDALAGAPSDGASSDDATASARATEAFGFVAGWMREEGAPGDNRPPVPLGPAPGGVYVAVPADVPVEDFHPPGARPGHTERLLPDPALLSRPGTRFAAGFASPAGLRPPPGRESAGEAGDGLPSAEALAAVRAAVTPEVLREHTARFSGREPLVEGDPLTVRSRHAATHDNTLVVRVLANRLQNLGLTVRLHPFPWRGHHLFNVEAEHTVDGSDATVLVTAHMDSTATSEDFVDEHGLPRPYDPAQDPAPGADDDASGTAAVLAAAACLRDLTAGGREPARSIRFVLFNAEEQGLVGSKFYARAAAAASDPIAGVLQMDMIAGHQPGTKPVVEVHAGSAVPGPVEEASDLLGDRVGQALLALAAEDPGGLGPKVQQLTGDADPAMGRSDHASFHERGYAAVAVSEDLFATPGGAEGTGTRQYHTTGDTVTDVDHDPDFATTVARAVTATALTLAGV